MSPRILCRRVRPTALAAGLAGLLSVTGCGAPANPVVQASGNRAHGTAAKSSPRAATAVMPPRFFADTVNFASGGGPLQIRKTSTGALVAQDQHTSGVTGLAATGGGRFLIALPVRSTCATQIYRFRLNDRGRPGRLSPLGHELRGELWSMAASAKGRVIGYAISGCAKGEPGYLRVLHVRTGRTRQWGDVNLGGVSPGNVALSGALSMSASGTMLAFPGQDVAANGRVTRQVVRVLPTNARPGTVAQRSRIVLSRPAGQASPLAASLSPSADSVYLCTVSASRTQRVTKVAAYRMASGRLREVIATLRGKPYLAGCPIALDTSGRFVLVPYSLRPAHYPAGHAVFLIARIRIATKTIATLKLRLPPNAGMDPYTSMMTAW